MHSLITIYKQKKAHPPTVQSLGCACVRIH
nr:MAG TPA: hypothetical protein [Caudoviricetes sp.]